jgi:hypothetical protein
MSRIKIYEANSGVFTAEISLPTNSLCCQSTTQDISPIHGLLLLSCRSYLCLANIILRQTAFSIHI